MYGLILDADNIRKLLMDFNLLTGINISFASYDYKYAVSLPTIDNTFCKTLRKNPEANKKCLECDKRAFETAEKTRSIFIYECHAGLTEAISPIIDDNKIIGYLFMGKVLMEAPTPHIWEKIYHKCKNYDVDFEELKNHFYVCPSLTTEKIQAAARIMDMSAKYICLTKLAKLKSQPLIENIKDYIGRNLNKKISTSELCKKFSISQSHLCHTVKHELGMTVSEYKLQKRVEKARELLEKTELSVKDIGDNVGFNDQNFFARVFKRATGYTPTQYRIKFK